MIQCNQSVCPMCGGMLKYYDSVERSIRKKYGCSFYIQVRRFRCSSCGAIHRETSDMFFPYKQYEAEIIQGVLENLITCDTLGFEDYPSDQTKFRWLLQKQQLNLWRNS